MNAILVNALLALFWLLLAGNFFLYEQLYGVPLRYRLPLGGINPGWLAILFAAFNCYRAGWTWSYRRRRKREIAEQEAFHQRLGRHHREEARREEPPDPNFIFTDEPAARPPEKPL